MYLLILFNHPLVHVYKGIQNLFVMDSNPISKNLLFLKREVEGMVGQRDLVATFTDRINPVIGRNNDEASVFRNVENVIERHG